MKKLTLILLSILMIFSLAACGSRCEQHTYDSVCDTECNVCGERRGVMHRFSPADCFDPSICDFCGATQGEPLGHTTVTDAAVPPTCTESGLTEGSHCSVCDTVLVAQEEVPTVAHSFVSSVVTEPTCTESGYTTYICSCKYEQVVIDTPPTGHEYEEEYTAVKEGHYQACICHPEIVELLPHSDDDGDTICDGCGYELNCLYTVTLDRAHESVQVDFISVEDGTTHTVYTAANGAVTVSLPKGAYTLNITHYNSAHIWLDMDNGVTLTEENSSYTAEFEVSTERSEYVFSIYSTDGSTYTEGTVFVYTPQGSHDGALSVNSRGQAITYMYNEDRIVSVFAGGLHKTLFLAKDGPTTVDVYMDNTAPLGSEENPMPILNLENLPFADSFVASLPFDNSYDFEAGESMYLLLPYADRKVITLGTDKLILEYGGEVREANDRGEYIINAPHGESIIIKLTATEACTEAIAVSHPGSIEEPINLISSSDSYTHTEVLYLVEGESVYFYIYCYPDSTLAVSVSGATVTLDDGEMTNTPSDGVHTICVTAEQAGTFEIRIDCARD
uniref:hypothetical protein n=1 Tax=Alistipes sp. TaxID=1872444 RepID=UPI004056336C